MCYLTGSSDVITNEKQLYPIYLMRLLLSAETKRQLTFDPSAHKTCLCVKPVFWMNI